MIFSVPDYKGHCITYQEFVDSHGIYYIGSVDKCRTDAGCRTAKEAIKQAKNYIDTFLVDNKQELNLRGQEGGK